MLKSFEQMLISNLVNPIHGTIVFLWLVLLGHVSRNVVNVSQTIATKRDSDHLEAEKCYNHRKCFMTTINHFQSKLPKLD